MNAEHKAMRIQAANRRRARLLGFSAAGCPAGRSQSGDSYGGALTLQLGPDDEEFVDGLVPPGHASTPGYTDPGYPVEGRQA